VIFVLPALVDWLVLQGAARSGFIVVAREVDRRFVGRRSTPPSCPHVSLPRLVVVHRVYPRRVVARHVIGAG
jgi:hypothetical protein